MHIVIAPDSFKGSVSAIDAAEAMKSGLSKVFPQATFKLLPIADGGEGTVDALVCATGGHLIQSRVSDPLGRPIQASWGILGDGHTAVMEMAAASGLPLLSRNERNPLITSTYGTGELIRAALDNGIQKIILGIGGSATNDGGSGMMHALGVRFLNADKEELPPGGAALCDLETIDLSGLDPRLATVEIAVACDVDNPLCGPCGASAIYGPQKGATPSAVARLDKALARFAEVAEQMTGCSVVNRSGAGAAGGLGAGLLLFTPAVLRPGIELVLETIDFETALSNASLIFTGEGRTDAQTVFGKAPVGVAKAAARFNLPVVCLSGGLGDGYEQLYQCGLDAITAIAPGPISLERCMKEASLLIAASAERAGRLLSVGAKLAAQK